jgi:hypothetical protein
VRDRDIPVAVVHIDHPEGYVHFHADVHARVGQPGYRNPNRVVVNHPAGPPPHRMAPNAHPMQPREMGHGPVEHPAQNANHEPPHEMNTHEPAHPAEAPHQVPHEMNTHEGAHPEPASTHEPLRPEPPKQVSHPAAAPHPAPAYKAPPPPKKKK